jgi:hypothetical protein
VDDYVRVRVAIQAGVAIPGIAGFVLPMIFIIVGR